MENKNKDIWIYNPLILFNKNDILKIWPSSDMNFNEKINAITRLIFIITILGYLFSQNLRILIIGIITILCIAIFYIFQNKKSKSSNIEHFSNHLNTIKKNTKNIENEESIEQIGNIIDYTKPKENNPVMNVLLTDISDHPNREPAAPTFNEHIEKEINTNTQDFISKQFNNSENIQDKLFKDLGDSVNFDHSMRNWYATPNTEIPNDQKAFAEFCYGDMQSCKEGNSLACMSSMPRRVIDGTQ